MNQQLDRNRERQYRTVAQEAARFARQHFYSSPPPSPHREHRNWWRTRATYKSTGIPLSWEHDQESPPSSIHLSTLTHTSAVSTSTNLSFYTPMADQTAPRISNHELPHYDGTEDPEDFIWAFNAYAHLQQWTPESSMDVLPLALTGTARSCTEFKVNNRP